MDDDTDEDEVPIDHFEAATAEDETRPSTTSAETTLEQKPASTKPALASTLPEVSNAPPSPQEGRTTLPIGSNSESASAALYKQPIASASTDTSATADAAHKAKTPHAGEVDTAAMKESHSNSIVKTDGMTDEKPSSRPNVPASMGNGENQATNKTETTMEMEVQPIPPSTVETQPKVLSTQSVEGNEQTDNTMSQEESGEATTQENSERPTTATVDLLPTTSTKPTPKEVGLDAEPMADASFQPKSNPLPDKTTRTATENHPFAGPLTVNPTTPPKTPGPDGPPPVESPQVGLHVPYSVLKPLYEAMCEQDVDDGASNRRETRYLNADGLMEKLKSIENNACKMKLFEDKTLEVSKALGLIDEQLVHQQLGYCNPLE